MAKQSGIHQLRGKVGEMSYYRQKGVQPGLVRKINSSLSSRVKTDDAYANTRLNNAEFKNANAIATAAFRSVPRRKSGMMVNFAVAAMTKAALESIKQGTGSWGARVPNVELDALIVDLLENHAKLGAYNGQYGLFTLEEVSSAGAVEVHVDGDSSLADHLLSQGIDGFSLVPMKGLAGEIMVDNLPRLYAGSNFGLPINQEIEPGTAFSWTIRFQINTPESVGMSQSGYTFAQEDAKHGFWCVIAILPYRLESGRQYTLQEKCTFVSIPLGQIPEP